MAKFELTLRRIVTQKTTVVVDMPDGRPIDEPSASAAEPEVLA